MVAGEEKLVAVKKHDVAARVTRRWNHEQVVVELYWFFASNHVLDAETPRAIVSVHESFAVEFLTKQLVRGNVVFVREQHATDAAHRFDSLHELTRKTRRVDQDVAAFTCWTRDQITPRAEA